MQAGAQTIWQKARVLKLEKRLSAQRVLCQSLRTGSAFESIAEAVLIDMQKKLFRLRGETLTHLAAQDVS